MNMTLIDAFAALAMLVGDLFAMMSVLGSAMVLILAILSAASNRHLRATDQVFWHPLQPQRDVPGHISLHLPALAARLSRLYPPQAQLYADGSV